MGYKNREDQRRCAAETYLRKKAAVEQEHDLWADTKPLHRIVSEWEQPLQVGLTSVWDFARAVK